MSSATDEVFLAAIYAHADLIIRVLNSQRLLVPKIKFDHVKRELIAGIKAAIEEANEDDETSEEEELRLPTKTMLTTDKKAAAKNRRRIV